MYSPLDPDEPDDFSHLPSVDGAPENRISPMDEPEFDPSIFGEPESAPASETVVERSTELPAEPLPEPMPEPLPEPVEEPSPPVEDPRSQRQDANPELPTHKEPETALETPAETEELPAVDDEPAETPGSGGSEPETAAGKGTDKKEATEGVVRTTEGDEPDPAEKEPFIQDAKKKALIWAGSLHVFVFLVLALVRVTLPPDPPSEIVAISEVQNEKTPDWKKVAPQAPQVSSASSVKPIVAMTAGAVVMPEIEIDPSATSLNIGASFGSFGGGGGTAGGTVQFMGNSGRGQYVVFVVDMSGSMSRGAEVGGQRVTRLELLKKELSRALDQFRNGGHYQVLFFSDFAWPHNRVDASNGREFSEYRWRISPEDRDVEIPRFDYVVGSPNAIRASKEIIDEAINPGGTNWGSGLLMALNARPKPDVVFFMTDGSSPDGDEWVERVSEVNSRGKRSVIHTTSMMEPDAVDELRDLAQRNGGKFTVVEADGRVVQGEFVK